MKKMFGTLLIVGSLCQSCEGLKQSSKYGFSEGYYKGHFSKQPAATVYVFPDEDSVKVYTKQALAAAKPDSVKSLYNVFPHTIPASTGKEFFFVQHTFDLDFLSILVKYRPNVNGFPNQFNTSILNGAVFIGYRTDIYRLHYHPTPFHTSKRDITHYGFSFGAFTGLGATRIDEYVTEGALNIQYDGVVNPSGIAAILAVNKLTFGLTGGVDHLLDKNHSYWIYQGKPWIGLSVGLNLN